MQNQIGYICKKNNILEELIIKYPHFFEKHSSLISFNPNINIKIIEEHKVDKINWFLCSSVIGIDTIKHFPNLPWHWYSVSKSFKTSMSDIERNMKLPWSWHGISRNININLYFIKKYKSLLDWYWITKNPVIKADDIKNNPDLPWDIDTLYENPNIDIFNIDISMLSIENWKELSLNIKINLNIFEKYIDKWDYQSLSKNENLISCILEKYPNLNWDWDCLSRHPNININHLAINDYVNWDYLKNICIKTIKEYPNINWNFNAISCDSNITIEDIENNPELPWNFRYVSLNPNITIDFVEKNLDKIDWEFISLNKFLYDDVVYKKNIEKDMEERRIKVKTQIKDIFYNDICCEVLKYVGYD